MIGDGWRATVTTCLLCKTLPLTFFHNWLYFFPKYLVPKIKMSSKRKLYYIKESPPCHTVIAVARLLAIDLELIEVSDTYQSKQYAKVQHLDVLFCRNLTRFLSSSDKSLQQGAHLGGHGRLQNVRVSGHRHVPHSVPGTRFSTLPNQWSEAASGNWPALALWTGHTLSRPLRCYR